MARLVAIGSVTEQVTDATTTDPFQQTTIVTTWGARKISGRVFNIHMGIWQISTLFLKNKIKFSLKLNFINSRILEILYDSFGCKKN